MSIRIFQLIFIVLISTSCNKKNTDTEQKPVQNTIQNKAQSLSSSFTILEFSAEKSLLHAGEKTKLQWQIVGAKSAQISAQFNAQSMPLQTQEINANSVEITPDITTAYTLSIEDESGNRKTARLTIDVIPATSKPQSYPLLFITQVPVPRDLNSRLSAFANHMTSPKQVPLGGDLMLRFPDGTLRNLSKEAQLGMQGFQGANAIAVREPSVHWSGQKALISILYGSPKKQEPLDTGRWQIYEVTGLGKYDKVSFQRLEKQDPRYNNIAPLYANDEAIIFISDRPRVNQPHLYPQLDEYEATPTVSGIWKMDSKDGHLQLLSHTPSGAFNPIIDSFGRLIFTRWDHLQQDQLADRDRDAEHNKVAQPFRSFNYTSEAADARPLNNRTEFFPESRVDSDSAFGAVNAFRNNIFTIWQINQDGSSEETLNHVGQHEFAFGYLMPNFKNDAHLSNHTNDVLHANQFRMRHDGGLFHLSEDPLEAGSFYAINARENGSFTTDTIVKINGRPGINPEQMRIQPVTEPAKSDNLKDGRFRNPLPLSDGRLIASHTSTQLPPDKEYRINDLRLRYLEKDLGTGYFHAGKPLTKGIKKSVQWWDGEQMRSYQGDLWELEAVEVRPRMRPSRATTALEAPERAVLNEEHIDENALRNWLQKNKLALIITRDQTSRDRADLQQPYNLQVPGGVKTISKDHPEAKVYDISQFQIVQAEQLRAYPDRAGRRNLAQPIQNFEQFNPVDGGVKSSVKIAKDGSTAAFVPAERALSWQTTDKQGNAVVKERNWVTFQSGEIRTCAACHGINSKNQANVDAPAHKPEALRELLKYWKNTAK